MLKTLFLYIPISVIGFWRWSYWLVRMIGASLYRPGNKIWPSHRQKPSISVITPVYNEDEALFKAAVGSWIKNGVTEIIAVIDKSNTRLIAEFERAYSKHPEVKCRLVVTPKKGKRAALCDGIVRAKGDLIALVDSDTVWDDNVAKRSLPFFLNPNIGAVTVAQRISNPHTLSNILFDILLWVRYREEVPFLLGLGKAFNTLSGRTAIYRREAVLNPEYDNVHELRHEFFMGTRGVSGDDKRLTHLILQQGWHVGFAKGTAVYTLGMDDMKTFMKQRLRWTRNSWRADIRAIRKGWVWRHPALAFFMIDRFIQPFFMLIGPIVFITSLISGQWTFAAILMAWWLVSRFIKLFGYFRRYPARLIYLPPYILYSYINVIIKIYALATVIENSWATRWHKARLMAGKTALRRSATMALGGATVGLFIWFITGFVARMNSETAVAVSIPPPVTMQEFNQSAISAEGVPASPRLPKGVVLPAGVKVYTVESGDSWTSISQKLGVDYESLKKMNGIKDTSKIYVGQEVLYYNTSGGQS